MEYKNQKTLSYFCLIWGTLYLVAGLLGTIKGAGLLPEDFISANILPPEIAGGLVLVIIAAIYLYGVLEFSRGSSEGKAYAYVGLILSLLFGALYFLTFLADLINARVLFADGFEDWTVISGFKPALYLGLLSLAGYLNLKNKFELAE
jgi:hypothetical protein